MVALAVLFAVATYAAVLLSGALPQVCAGRGCHWQASAGAAAGRNRRRATIRVRCNKGGQCTNASRGSRTVRHAGGPDNILVILVLLLRSLVAPLLLVASVVLSYAATIGPATAAVCGHGLIGMREQVTVYGGDLEAGSEPDGGFAVRARLPLAAA